LIIHELRRNLNSQKSPLNEAPRENADAGARWLTSLPPVVIVCIAFGLAVTRGIFVRNAFENAGSCESCLFWQTFASDLWVVGAIAVLGALQLFVGSRLRTERAGPAIDLPGADVGGRAVVQNTLFAAHRGHQSSVPSSAPSPLREVVLWCGVDLAAARRRRYWWKTIVWSALRARGSHRRAAAMLAGLALRPSPAAAVGASAQFQFVVEEWVRNWFAMNFRPGRFETLLPALRRRAASNNPPASARLAPVRGRTSCWYRRVPVFITPRCWAAMAGPPSSTIATAGGSPTSTPTDSPRTTD
jgi:hypothetical protein